MTDEGETCPAGSGREKHALGGWLGQDRLAINSLFVKKEGVGWDTCPAGSGRDWVRLG